MKSDAYIYVSCKRFGTRGRGVGQLQRPTGIAALPTSGNLVVADYENRCLSIFDPDGRFVSRMGVNKLLGESR
jgi:tripartite motif-containing protein 2/3